MSREVKFRAWDIQGASWVKQTGNPYIFPFNGIVAMKRAGESTGHIRDEDFSEFYTLEQHNGKKDMDGTKIFAGDVVAVYPDDHWDGSLGKEARFLVTKEMNFLGMQFSVDHISGYECITHILESDDEEIWANAKIIGNIHENPELLK